MSELTEKYHLVDSEHGVTFTINNHTFLIKDFSNLSNINLVPVFMSLKTNFQITIDVLKQSMRTSDLNDPNVIEAHDEGVSFLFEIIFQLFNNLIVDLYKVKDFRNVFSSNFKEFFETVIELITCFEIAIYSGMKKLRKKQSEAIKKLKEDKNLIVVDEYGNLIEDKDLINKVEELIKEKFEGPGRDRHQHVHGQ